jgi:hypothetical protein
MKQLARADEATQGLFRLPNWQRLGTFVPCVRFKSIRKSPPELTLEERAELERRYASRADSIRVEAMLKSLDFDAPPRLRIVILSVADLPEFGSSASDLENVKTCH